MEEQRVSLPTVPEMAQLSAHELATAAARACPVVDTINIDKSSGVHIGPKIVSVVQNIDNSEKVKGHFLGLEWVTKLKRSRRLRCSVAVFLCWAVIICIGLAIYLFCFLLYPRPTRLDIDLPFHQYVGSVIRNTSTSERLACAAIILLLIGCISIIVYFAAFSGTNNQDSVDRAPHEWNITREMWLADPYNLTVGLNSTFEPVRLVVINHSVSPECHDFIQCAAELRNLQDYFIKHKDRDIPYNFIVGNDGRIYEGRGWKKEGAHTTHYNRCSIGIGFIGDYRETMHTRVTEKQINRTHMLLQNAVEYGYLHPKYVIVGHRDIYDSESPGMNLYKSIRTWAHYDNNVYRGKLCAEIAAMEI